jgi:hypothetical protein
MQAKLRACGATLFNKSVEKVAVVHQHGSWVMPVSNWRSMAHWLAWPHRGQQSGLGVAAWAIGVGGSKAMAVGFGMRAAAMQFRLRGLLLLPIVPLALACCFCSLP